MTLLILAWRTCAAVGVEAVAVVVAACASVVVVPATDTRAPAVRAAVTRAARRRAPANNGGMGSPTPAGLAVGFGRKCRPAAPCYWQQSCGFTPRSLWLQVAWFPGPVPG